MLGREFAELVNAYLSEHGRVLDWNRDYASNYFILIHLCFVLRKGDS